MMGDKADGTGLTGVDQLLKAGYAVASVNYRLSDVAKYPAQINESRPQCGSCVQIQSSTS